MWCRRLSTLARRIRLHTAATWRLATTIDDLATATVRYKHTRFCDPNAGTSRCRPELGPGLGPGLGPALARTLKQREDAAR